MSAPLNRVAAFIDFEIAFIIFIFGSKGNLPTKVVNPENDALSVYFRAGLVYEPQSATSAHGKARGDDATIPPLFMLHEVELTR